MAIEDIGLADPRAHDIALNACLTYERLGSPEGELALANAVIYLAVAAKSNAAYSAYNAARAFVGNDATRPVPEHLRNAPTRLMKISATARVTVTPTMKRMAMRPASATCPMGCRRYVGMSRWRGAWNKKSAKN